MAAADVAVVDPASRRSFQATVHAQPGTTTMTGVLLAVKGWRTGHGRLDGVWRGQQE